MGDEQPQQQPQEGQPQSMPLGGGFAVPVRGGLEPSIANTVLRPEDVLERFENILRGNVEGEYGSWTRDEKRPVYMNEKGVSFTMLNLYMLHSRITTLANKGDLQLYDELYTFMANYAIWLRTNAEEINFSPQYYNTFVSMIATTLSSTYSRALLGDDKSFMLALPSEGLKVIRGREGSTNSGGGWNLFKM